MRKNAVMMKIVVVAIVFALMVVPVQAQDGSVSYGGIEFPLGNVSFADGVVSFNPGSGTGESDGSAAIGPSDGGKGTGPSVIGAKGDVTLGKGGSITLKFTDNYLLDVEGLDLYVFEYGPDVESFKVEISKDGSGWIDLGTVRGQPTGLDIHGKVAPGDRFSYVRITDANPYAPRDPKIIGTEAYWGADIDAVGAIGAEERPDSDGDGVPDDIDECSGTPAGVAVDDKGCPPCVADFWCSPRTGVAPMRVECFDYSYELPVSWTWDFGDGTTSTVQNPVHIYTVPGRYVITLRVECASGVIDTLETYVDVELPTDEEECRADFLIEQNRCRFQFFDISQGDPVEWQWNFGDSFAGEGADTSTAQNPAYGYLYSSDNASGGSYQVTLSIRCRDGNESSISKHVQCEKGNQSINCSWDAPSSCSQWNRSSTPDDYARVLFLTDPPGATIFIDGYSNPCTTPAVVQFLDEGTYNIRVRKNLEWDCKDVFDIISVVHGDVYCREYTLRCRGGPHVEQESQQVTDLRGTMTTDPQGNLYVIDYGNGTVILIGPDGTATTYASGIDRPRSPIFDDTGNLYVGSFNGNIYTISPTGEKIVVANNIRSPQGMGFDSAGNLYVAGGYDGKIHCIAPDGSKTTMDSGFAHPKHLVVYSDGNIYVVDSNGTLIVRITPEGGKTSLIDLGETISGMATDGEYLYVSHADKISRIDTSGQVTQIATDLDQPSSLTVCNGSVFVTVSDGIVKLKISDETKTGTWDWTGAWETDWGRMELQQNGNNVNGTYTHDQGRIQGTVSGRNLTGTWSEYPSYSPPGDAGDMVFIISEDCSSFDGKWRYGTSGGWSGSWTGARESTGSGTSYPEATLTHSGFDFSEGTTGEYPTYDGEIIFWQPGGGTHPNYPRDSGYLWWRNANHASQTKDMGAVDIATVRAVPAEWDKSPLIPPLLVGHTIVAKCYDGYVKFQVISVDPADESARVKYLYSPDTTFYEGTPTP